MAKVKMSDVKSGSEAVKGVFRKPMTQRRKYVAKTQFTSEELIEILDISENIEYHKEKRAFYQFLIESQAGPFNSACFGAYVDKLFHVDSMLNLLANSQGISQDNKLRWLDYMMVSSTHWAVFNFFSKDAGNSYGIDVTKEPFRKNYANHIVRYSDKMGRGNINDEYYKELHRVLDTMSENEIFQWYLDSVKTTYEKRAIDFLMSYEKMPSKVIADYYEKTPLFNKEKLATHPNCPTELKMDMYEQTGKEEFLPKEAQDIFLF